MGLARSFQRTNIFPMLTVYENIQSAFIAHGGKGLNMWSVSEQQFRDETAQMIAHLALQDIAYSIAGEVSHGAQKQVELGIALAGEPRMLLLDEPTAGMSAQETHESISLLDRIAKERGLTLLFTEHDMDVVFSIAHQIAVLHQGRIIATGAPEEVRRNEEVRRVYLGEASIDGDARGRRHPHRLRQQPGAVRHLARHQAGRVRLPARPQWRRQDDHHALDHGADAAVAGQRAFQGQGRHGAVALPPGAARHRLRAGGPAHLRGAHRVGEPRRRGTLGQPRRALDGGHRRASSSPSSASCATAWAACFQAASSRC